MDNTPLITEDLVDIHAIKIDKNLPKEARIAQFVEQIKNPYAYKCGKYTITVSYAKSGLTLEDCLRQMVN